MNNVATIQPGHSTGLAMQPSNLQEAIRLSEMLASSGMVPKQYINNPQGTLVAMMMGHEIGLNPLQALQNIAVINGKPSIYADALLALVQNHPAFGGHEEEFDEQTMTASCTVWRKGEGKKHTQSFSQKDAQTAGLWGKQGPWTQYPKRMLMWRARGFALRDKFSDALGGLITVEEARDYQATEKDVTPKPEQESRPELSQKLSDEQVNELKAAIESHGVLLADFLAVAGTERIEDIQPQRYKGAMNWIKANAQEAAQ